MVLSEWTYDGDNVYETRVQGSKIPVQQISWKLSYKGNGAVEADSPCVLFKMVLCINKEEFSVAL